MRKGFQAEGENSPADVILTVDIGRLYIYEDNNLLSAIKSEILNKNIPSHLRSPNGKWYGLFQRARVIVTSKERVDINKIKNIEDLANPEWKGRICSRPGSHVYNRALMSSIIAAHGVESAEKWAKSLVNNLALAGPKVMIVLKLKQSLKVNVISALLIIIILEN